MLVTCTGLSSAGLPTAFYMSFGPGKKSIRSKVRRPLKENQKGGYRRAKPCRIILIEVIGPKDISLDSFRIGERPFSESSILLGNHAGGTMT